MRNPIRPPRRLDVWLLAAIIIGILLAAGSLELILSHGGLP